MKFSRLVAALAVPLLFVAPPALAAGPVPSAKDYPPPPAENGASRERVNKAIASFIRLGWLQQQDRTYRIIQRDRLELRAR